MNDSEFKAFIEEYKICVSEVSRLEGQIWKASSHLGIFSGAAILLKSVPTFPNKDNFYTTFAIAILMITISLVWWRLSRRWWSIQHVKLKRINEIEEKIGFSQSTAVKLTDKAKMAHIKYLQNKLQKMDDHLFYEIPKHIKPEKCSEKKEMIDHEYRGNQPILKFFVIVNILIWIGLVLTAAMPSKIYLWAFAMIFGLYFFYELKLWRKA